jgi:hypothetical protein
MEIRGPVLLSVLLLYVTVCFGLIAAKYKRNPILHGAFSVISPINLSRRQT